jgi:hypothetical protein
VTLDGKAGKDSSLVERWIEDQREWQKTAMAYLDSMVKNDDFLVHLGNAMRGSLLAGKPYPTATAAPAPVPAPEAPADDRLDRVLFALHEMQGQLSDLRLTLEELRNSGKGKPATMSRARKPAAKAAVAKPRRKTSGARKAGKTGKKRG